MSALLEAPPASIQCRECAGAGWHGFDIPETDRDGEPVPAWGFDDCATCGGIGTVGLEGAGADPIPGS